MKGRVVYTLAVVVLALTSLASPGTAQTKQLNGSMWLPPAHPLTKYGYAEWLNRIEKASGGSLKSKLFTGSALLAPQDHLRGIRDSIAHVGWVSGTYTPSDVPEDTMLSTLSFVYTDYFVGSFATTEINMTDPQLLEQWRKNGVVYLSGYSTPPYRLICSTKITSLDDIKGKKLRSAGGPLPDWAKIVGAIPVNVSSSESYTGIEKGQLDCATNALDDLRSRSYWDVAKHVSLVELGVYWSSNVMNRQFWQGLTTAQRKAILDTTAEAVVNTGVGYLEDVKAIVEQAKTKGVKFYEPASPLTASIDQFKAQAAQHAASLGANKFGVKNAAALVERFEGVAKKWQKLLEGVDQTDRQALLAIAKREIYDRTDPATYASR